MSSPSVDALNAQTFPKRNPRRRPRTETDSISSMRASQPQPKRSKIDQETFTDSANGNEANGHATNGHTSNSETASWMEVDIPTRAKPHKRSAHDDRSLLMAKTKTYNAKAVPNLPDQLRALDQSSFRGYSSPSTRLALAVTRDRAIVWDRTSTATSPATRTLILPNPSTENEPLALGALVTSESPQETGLIVVSATSGKITYWENLENAEALSLLHKHRNGIESSLGSLMSGETVEAIEPCGFAGFLLILSTGRTAQVLLRDPQSRPAISVRFLKADGNVSNSGFLTGLRNAFVGGNWLRKVVAAKSQPSVARGQMDVLLANEDAKFQFWQLGWAGQASFNGEVDACSALSQGVTRVLNLEAQSTLQVKLVDFAFASRNSPSKHSSMTASGKSKQTALIALVALSVENTLSFALVDLRIGEEEALVKNAMYLSTYESPPVLNRSWKPRILLSDSVRTAFVVFEKALVIVSIATLGLSAVKFARDDPDMPAPFEDTLYLRSNEDVRFVGADLERPTDKSGKATLVAFVRPSGLLKIQVGEPFNDREAVERVPTTVRESLEQAVFYGTRLRNPFRFRVQESAFDSQQVGEAALEISSAILRNDTPEDVVDNTILTHQLEARAELLHTLALHLKQDYPRLDKSYCWGLLEHAEKLATAQSLWRVYEGQRSRRGIDYRLAPQIIHGLRYENGFTLSEKSSKDDLVRHYFLNNVQTLGRFMRLIGPTVGSTLEQDLSRDELQAIQGNFISDANELVVHGFETTYKFRQESAWLYNLDNEPLSNGVLAPSSDYPTLWTMDTAMAPSASELVAQSYEYMIQDFDREEFPRSIAEVLLQYHARCIEVAHNLHQERLNYATCSAKPGANSNADKYREEQALQLLQALEDLHRLGNVDAAFAVGEKYEDMAALVTLCRAEIARGSGKTGPEYENIHSQCADRVKSWFARFGQTWADAFFGSLFEGREYQSLLNQSTTNRTELTRFLRQDPARGKVAWINEVTNEGDFARAGLQLLDNACRHDSTRFGIRQQDCVDASLAKLSLLAAEGNTAGDGHPAQARADQLVALTLIKRRLLKYFEADIRGSIDDLAASETITEDFCVAKEQSSLASIFEQAVGAFIGGWPADLGPLLDVLTLMKAKTAEATTGLDSSTGIFLAALEALHKATLERERDLYFVLEASTWRRLYLRDDWTAIDADNAMSDDERHAIIEQSTLFNVLLLARRKGLFDGTQGLEIPMPGNLLGVGAHQHDHASRYTNDELQERLAIAISEEDQHLRQAVEENHLESWVETVRTSTQRMVEHETQEKQRAALELREQLDRLHDPDASAAEDVAEDATVDTAAVDAVDAVADVDMEMEG